MINVELLVLDSNTRNHLCAKERMMLNRIIGVI